MAQYRKKPVIVEAEQFVIWDTKKTPPFITILGITFPVNKDCTIVVPTLEGQHIASNLDWIIRGVKGEVYPCKPDIFEATYEPVNQITMAQQKLYTEEQVRKAINDGSLYSYINGCFKFKNSEDDIINALTPIELPSDEEIEKRAERNINKYSFIDGVHWLKDKILNK